MLLMHIKKKEYFKNNDLINLSSKAEMQLSRLLKDYYIKVVDSNSNVNYM